MGRDSKPEANQNLQMRPLPAPSSKVVPSPAQYNKHSTSLPHPPSRSPINNLQSHPPPLNPRMGVVPYSSSPNGAQGYQQTWPKSSTSSQTLYPTATKYPTSSSSSYPPRSGFVNGAYSSVPEHSYSSTSVSTMPSPGQPRAHASNGTGGSSSHPSHMQSRLNTTMQSGSPTPSHESISPQIDHERLHAPTPHSPPHPPQPVASGMTLHQQAQVLLAVSQVPPPIPSSLPRP